MRRAVALVLVLALALPPAAFAERGSELTQAIGALDELRYEDALVLLERAWRSGKNGPEELALVFRLQGEVAATLGDEAGARAAFQRYWAIAPDARLPAGTSPKLVASFDAAVAALGNKRPLAVRAEPGEGELVVVIVSDPLGMVAGARATWRDEAGDTGAVEGAGKERVRLELPARGRLEVRAAVVDRFGNRLVELASVTVIVPRPADEAPRAKPAAGPPRPKLPPPGPPAPEPPPRLTTVDEPIYESPWLWGGLTLGALGTGLAFGLMAEDAQDELDALNADSESHPFSEAEAVERRLHRHVLVADVSFVAAGALAVVTGVMVWRRTRRGTGRVTLTPAAGAHGAGVSLEVRW